MVKLKRGIFLSNKNDGTEDPLLRLQEMEDLNEKTQVLKNEENEKGDTMNFFLGKRYFEHKDKPSTTSGEKFKLLTHQD